MAFTRSAPKFALMHQTPTQRLAANVRAEVARQRVTQSTIARLLELDQRAVSRRMVGDVAFSATELAAVARHLGVRVDQLLEVDAAVDEQHAEAVGT